MIGQITAELNAAHERLRAAHVGNDTSLEVRRSAASLFGGRVKKHPRLKLKLMNQSQKTRQAQATSLHGPGLLKWKE